MHMEFSRRILTADVRLTTGGQIEFRVVVGVWACGRNPCVSPHSHGSTSQAILPTAEALPLSITHTGKRGKNNAGCFKMIHLVPNENIFLMLEMQSALWYINQKKNSPNFVFQLINALYNYVTCIFFVILTLLFRNVKFMKWFWAEKLIY